MEDMIAGHHGPNLFWISGFPTLYRAYSERETETTSMRSCMLLHALPACSQALPKDRRRMLDCFRVSHALGSLAVLAR